MSSNQIPFVNGPLKSTEGPRILSGNLTRYFSKFQIAAPQNWKLLTFFYPSDIDSNLLMHRYTFRQSLKDI